jgi:TATA-binding protein-associated factor
MGIANSVVNIENSSLSSMGTEQLLDMFTNESTEIKSTLKSESSASNSNTKAPGHGYQKLLENLNELWDEKQYESEYNLDNFIKNLNQN